MIIFFVKYDEANIIVIIERLEYFFPHTKRNKKSIPLHRLQRVKHRVSLPSYKKLYISSFWRCICVVKQDAHIVANQDNDNETSFFECYSISI